MSSEGLLSPTRRTVLAGIGSSVLAFGVGVGTAGADEHADVVVRLDNVGASAWEVTDVEGEDVAPIGEENPTLTLSVGTRYAFENGGWDAHPLAFRDADSEPVLTQAGSDDDDGGGQYSTEATPLVLGGEYADDPDVNWIDEGEMLMFTLTEDLAQDIDDYICTVHSAMNGEIEVTGLADDEPDEDDTDEPADDDPDDEPDEDDTDEPADDDPDDDEEPDDDGPGFGPIAAIAGAGGVAAYAYRKLGFDGKRDAPD